MFSEFYSDIMDKCLAYGKVLELKVPRPKFIDRSDANAKDDEEKKRLEEEEKLKNDPDADLRTTKRKL